MKQHPERSAPVSPIVEFLNAERRRIEDDRDKELQTVNTLICRAVRGCGGRGCSVVAQPVNYLDGPVGRPPLPKPDPAEEKPRNSRPVKHPVDRPKALAESNRSVIRTAVATATEPFNAVTIAEAANATAARVSSALSTWLALRQLADAGKSGGRKLYRRTEYWRDEVGRKRVQPNAVEAKYHAMRSGMAETAAAE